MTKNIQDLPLKKLNTGKRGGPTIVDIFKTVHLKEKIVCGNFSDGLQMAMITFYFDDTFGRKDFYYLYKYTLVESTSRCKK